MLATLRKSLLRLSDLLMLSLTQWKSLASLRKVNIKMTKSLPRAFNRCHSISSKCNTNTFMTELWCNKTANNTIWISYLCLIRNEFHYKNK